MSQNSFDFLPKPDEKDREIQKWVEDHNRRVTLSAHVPSPASGSLLVALDRKEAKANAVYLLRGALGQQLRKSMVPGALSLKKEFIRALRGEMAVKKTSMDPALTVREILLRMRRSS